ncbi:MAG: hypothetical protein LBL00_07855 [Endomicrobium sp.]|nr:hypothetical protein [Endomicrobium sp.]
MPQIPQNTNRVQRQAGQAPQLRIANQPEAAFGGQVGQAVERLGQSVSKFGQILESIKIDERNIKLTNYQNKLKAELSNLKSQYNSGQIQVNSNEELRDIFSKSAEQIGIAELGQDLYQQYSAAPSYDNFMTAAKYDLDADFATQAYYANVANSKILNNDAANNALADPVNAEKIIAQRQAEIDKLNLLPKEKIGLKKDVRRDYALGNVEKELEENTYLTVSELAANDPKWEALTPAEHIRGVNKGNAIIAKREETSQDRQLEGFYNLFDVLYQNGAQTQETLIDLIDSGAIKTSDPEKLKKFVSKGKITDVDTLLNVFTDSRDSLKREFGISDKKQNAARESWQASANDVNSADARNARNLFEAAKAEYEGFGLIVDEQGKILKGNQQKYDAALKNPQFLADYLNRMEANISGGAFRNNTPQAQRIYGDAEQMLGLALGDRSEKITKSGDSAAQAGINTIVASFTPREIRNNEGERVNALYVGETQYKNPLLSRYDIPLQRKSIIRPPKALEPDSIIVTQRNISNIDAVNDIAAVFVQSVQKAKAQRLNLNAIDDDTKAKFNDIVIDTLQTHIANMVGAKKEDISKTAAVVSYGQKFNTGNNDYVHVDGNNIFIYDKNKVKFNDDGTTTYDVVDDEGNVIYKKDISNRVTRSIF